MNPNLGWAVGGGSVIFHTSDGGTTWVAQSSGIANILSSGSFVDAATGWLVGTGGTILHTTDGGAHWLSQSSGTTTDLNGVSFTGPGSGCAVGEGGTILKTTDGGASWVQQASGTLHPLGAIHFIDEANGWIVGHFGTILHTSDGGTTWSPQSSGSVEYFEAVQFTDANTGWAAGTNGTILHTTDGGVHWSPQASGIDISLLGISFTDPNNGWITGSDLQMSGVGSVLHTDNGGATWTIQADGTNQWLSSVFFIDAHAGWVSGTDGTILHTATGGTGVLPPDPPVLHSPGTGSLTGRDPVVSWDASSGALSYTLQLSRSSFFVTSVLNRGDINGTSFQLPQLEEGRTYYWRVSTTHGAGTSGWSGTWAFTTTDFDCDSILFFNAKCNRAGAVRSLVRLSGDRSGQTVTFDLDGEAYPVPLISNGTLSIARLEVPGVAPGTHTVSLEVPAGCREPVNVNCSADEPMDPGWEALWTQGAEESKEGTFVGPLQSFSYPNPFNPSTSIRYVVRERTVVSVSVYDLVGRLVRNLVREEQEKGIHEILWDSRNDSEDPVAGGIYLYRIVAGNSVRTGKMLLLK